MLRGRFVVVASLGLAGCGSSSTEAPSEVVTTPTTQSATAQPAGSAVPLASGSGALTRAPRRQPDATLFRALPSECPKGRVYIQTDAFLGQSGIDALDAAMTKLVAELGHARGESVEKAMRDAGLGVRAVRELAVCITDKTHVFALRISPPALRKDLVEALESVFRSMDLPPTTLNKWEGGTWVFGGNKAAIALTWGPDDQWDVMTIAEKREVMEDALVVGGGAAGFVDAQPYLVWVRTKEFEGTVIPARENYEFSALTPPPVKHKEAWKKDPDAVITELRADLESAKKKIASSPLSGGLPILDNMTIDRAGDEIRVRSVYRSSVMPDLYAGLARASFADFEQLFR